MRRRCRRIRYSRERLSSGAGSVFVRSSTTKSSKTLYKKGEGVWKGEVAKQLVGSFGFVLWGRHAMSCVDFARSRICWRWCDCNAVVQRPVRLLYAQCKGIEVGGGRKKRRTNGMKAVGRVGPRGMGLRSHCCTSHDPITHAPPQRIVCSTASNSRIISKIGHFCRVFYTFKCKYINFNALQTRTTLPWTYFIIRKGLIIVLKPSSS